MGSLPESSHALVYSGIRLIDEMGVLAFTLIAILTGGRCSSKPSLRERTIITLFKG